MPHTPKLDERKPQIDKFREAARKLETDESEENFDRILKKVAKAKRMAEDGSKESNED